MRKRSEAGPGIVPPPTTEPDPWDLKGQSTTPADKLEKSSTYGKPEDQVPKGIDFDKMASDLRERSEDGAEAVVEVNFGEELFQPVQYNSFRHGGFKVAARVRKGETIADACERIHSELQRAFERTYPEKRDGYVKRLASLGEEVERLRR